METNKDVLHKIRVYLYENYLTDNQYSVGTMLKEPRTAVFEKILTAN